MKYRHATPRRNLRSIMANGLLTKKSKGALKAVWLHTPSKTEWAILHVVKRHKCRAEDVVVIEVDVPRSWVVKGGKVALWRTRGHNVLPRRLGPVHEFAEFAG